MIFQWTVLRHPCIEWGSWGWIAPGINLLELWSTFSSQSSRPQGTPLNPWNSSPHSVSSRSCRAVCCTNLCRYCVDKYIYYISIRLVFTSSCHRSGSCSPSSCSGSASNGAESMVLWNSFYRNREWSLDFLITYLLKRQLFSRNIWLVVGFYDEVVLSFVSLSILMSKKAPLFHGKRSELVVVFL